MESEDEDSHTGKGEREWTKASPKRKERMEIVCRHRIKGRIRRVQEYQRKELERGSLS